MTSPPRVIVTGSRDWHDKRVIYDAMRRTYVRLGERPFVLVHGDCPTGADKIAEVIACSSPLDIAIDDIEAWPADWQKYGGSAGPIRNEAMVAAGADRCLAFILNLSRGSCGCAREAMKAGIPVDPTIRFEPGRMRREARR